MVNNSDFDGTSKGTRKNGEQAKSKEDGISGKKVIVTAILTAVLASVICYVGYPHWSRVLQDAAVSRAELIMSYERLQNRVVELAGEDNRESLIRVNAEKDDCRELEAHLAEVGNALKESAAYLGIPVRQETWIALEILMTDVTWSRESDSYLPGEKPAQTLTEVRMKNMPPVEEGLYD